MLLSQIGHRAIDIPGRQNNRLYMIDVNKRANRIVLAILAVIVIITALFAMWWFGLFLPSWSKYSAKGDYSTDYADGKVEFRNHTVTVYFEGKSVWRTKRDWSVQDLIIKDIDRDGVEELVMLVWKHGSFGNSRPQWVKHNDIKLEQHIFIYGWDDDKDSKIRALWMSSTIGKEIRSIANGPFDSIIVNEDGITNSWVWQDFGLKMVGATTERTTSVVCAGDNLLNTNLLNKTEHYEDFYSEIKPVIENYDIAVVNQETPFVKDVSQISDYPRFGTPVAVGDALAGAGFDIIDTANNHILDKGIEGIRNTLEVFEKYEDVVTVGTSLEEQEEYWGSIRFVEKNGIKIAFLAYTYGTNGMPAPKGLPFAVEQLNDEKRIELQLNYARARADAVIVLVHWGEEYSDVVSDEQKRLTELFYSNDVDVVIGSHPHVLQPKEIYKDKMLVYYSLGNFISGQTRKQQIEAGTETGGLASLTIRKDAAGKVSVIDDELILIKAQNPVTVIEK